MILRVFATAMVSSLLALQCFAQNTTAPVSEIHRLLLEDQRDRTEPQQDRGSGNMVMNDAVRRKRAHELLDQGVLQTGADFFDAAVIFQHGNKPDDYLLAHVLAMVAVAKGNLGARAISAATLDRYLQSIDEPQVFGTQYLTPGYVEYLRNAQAARRKSRETTSGQVAARSSATPAVRTRNGGIKTKKSSSSSEEDARKWKEFVQEPYNSGLISDSLRAQYCIMGVEEQKKELASTNSGKDFSRRPIPGC